MFVTGPGHGGPALVANAYLEGTYSEVYPDVSRDEDGMRRLFRQFSFPGGIPSHVAPETPGSINEGGELGYSLAHAYGAAFDNHGLLVVCVVGDGEAETGRAGGQLALQQVPRPGARRGGAADPAPQRLQDRQPDGARAHPGGRAARCCSRGTATACTSSSGDEPMDVHRQFAEVLDEVVREIDEIQSTARSGASGGPLEDRRRRPCAGR